MTSSRPFSKQACVFCFVSPFVRFFLVSSTGLEPHSSTVSFSSMWVRSPWLHTDLKSIQAYVSRTGPTLTRGFVATGSTSPPIFAKTKNEPNSKTLMKHIGDRGKLSPLLNVPGSRYATKKMFEKRGDGGKKILPHGLRPILMRLDLQSVENAYHSVRSHELLPENVGNWSSSPQNESELSARPLQSCFQLL